ESIPGIKLEKPLKTLLSSVKSVGLEGNTLKIEGRAVIPVEPGGGLPTVQLKLNDATFDIVPDRTDPTRIELTNIKGLSISAMGAGGDINKIGLKLDRDSDKKPILKIEIPAPVAAKPQGSDALQRLSQNWNQLANSVMPPIIKLEVPPGSKDDTARFEQVFALAKSWVEAPRQADAYIKMIEAASGAKLEQPLKDMVCGISSFSKEGDRIHITRAKGTSHDLGGVTLDVSRTLSFKISDDKNGIKV